MSSIFTDTVDYLTTAANWGNQGLALQIGQHLKYTAIAVAIAAAIAVPIGLFVGHTGRGQVVVVSLVNVLRALPTLGLLLLLILWFSFGLWPTMVALIILAIPPLLGGTYAGIANVDKQTVDAAKGVGYTGFQILTKVEIPIALPLILGGLRSAILQVVATAAIAAYAGLGGLGRPIFDGLATYNYPPMIAGSILVTVLALILDGLLVAATWFATPSVRAVR